MRKLFTKSFFGLIVFLSTFFAIQLDAGGLGLRSPECVAYRRGAGGFLAGTLVKTPGGYVPIEQLQVQDEVLSYDFKNTLVVQQVTHVHAERVNRYIQILIDNECICAAPDQLFYVPQEHSWVKAENITPDHKFLKNSTELFSIDGMIEVWEEVEVYDLTVPQFHNFCITSYDIPVHNDPVLVAQATARFLCSPPVVEKVVQVVGAAASFCAFVWGAFVITEAVSGDSKKSESRAQSNSQAVAAESYIRKEIKAEDREALTLRFDLKTPKDDKWEHYLQEKHNFGPNPNKDKIWKCARQVVMVAVAADRLSNGNKFEIWHITEIGLLTLQGIVLDNVIYISTMWVV